MNAKASQIMPQQANQISKYKTEESFTWLATAHLNNATEGFMDRAEGFFQKAHAYHDICRVHIMMSVMHLS